MADIFCQPNEITQSATFREGDLFNLILDPYPVSFGHSLIVPERHVEEINDLKKEEASKLMEMISEAKEFSLNNEKVKEKYFEILKADDQRSEEMIKTVLGSEREPEAFNIGVNEGEAAGQTIDHLHIHVIPRFEGDVEDPEGGVRNVIPERADYT